MHTRRIGLHCHSHYLSFTFTRNAHAGSNSIPGKGQQPRFVTATAHSGATENLKSVVPPKAEHKLQPDAAADDDFPATPLQSDPSHPQQSMYTPSDSEHKSYLHQVPATTPTSVVTRAAAHHVAGSENGARPSCLETQFDKSSSDKIFNDSNSQAQQQQQLARGLVKPWVESGADDLHSQLSPPQSWPSSPRSQSAEASIHGSSQKAVTHVNSYFDKSDEEDQDNSSNTSDLSFDQAAENGGRTGSHADGNSSHGLAKTLRRGNSVFQDQLSQEQQVATLISLS